MLTSTARFLPRRRWPCLPPHQTSEPMLFRWASTLLPQVCPPSSCPQYWSNLTVIHGPDKKTRDKAVKSLAAFLSSARQPLPKLEMAKLWKGIFYCKMGILWPCVNKTSLNLIFFQGYWMSDKPLVQQALASELAELLLTIPSTDNSLAFLSGFWEAIVREWNGIDRLRYVISAPHFFILI